MRLLLAELLQSSRVVDLAMCRGLCAIPSTTTLKKDLIQQILHEARDPQKHRAIFTQLTHGMTTKALRQWASGLRSRGFVLPPAKVMGRNRVDMMNALIGSDRPAGGPSPPSDGAGAYAPAPESEAGAGLVAYTSNAMPPRNEVETPLLQPADGARVYAQAPESEEGAETPSLQPASGARVYVPAPESEEGTVLVAYNSRAGPARVRRKLHKKWLKLAQEASLNSRVRRALTQALKDHADATVAVLRGVVGDRVGVALDGKYRAMFDKALLKRTAKPQQQRRPRKRFILAVSRRGRRQS